MSNQARVQNCSKSRINMMSRWISIWRRCYLPEEPSYEYYGARDIRVCQDWLDFQAFYNFWGDPPFEGATIGRIDNDGNYEPSNCEWQTQEQQNNNTRRSKLITWNGKTQSIRDWAAEHNIGTRRLWERLKRGWDMQRALEAPCPKGFQGELEERRAHSKQEWELKGHLYAARSKWRRGHRLSLHSQDLLAVEGVEQTRDLQVKKSKASKKAQSINETSANVTKTILLMRKDGLTIRAISHALNIPKSTIHYHLQRQGQ